MESLNFLYTVFFISIILHIAAGIITAAFVIPLQLQQVGVKNGLAKLRKQMVVKGFLSLVVIMSSILALTLRYVIHDIDILRYIIVTLILIHSLGALGKSYIDYEIYHQQYTEENKEIHEKIEREELKRKAQE